MPAEAWRVRRWLLLTVALGGPACARPPPVQAESQTLDPDDTPAGAEDDHSRCAYRGRADREVEEAATVRSARPSIRRVYAVVGEGEDAHRVLRCREVDQNLDGTKDVVRVYDEHGEPLKELADTDFDGRIDTWTTFVGGRVAEVDVDRNRDGRPDEKRHYVRGKKVRAELDEDFDGRVETWEVYEDGTLLRRGVDLDRDGKVDRWDRDEVAYRAAERRAQAEEERAEQQRRDAEQSPRPADSARPDGTRPGAAGAPPPRPAGSAR
jgi:hypothetical protein